MLNKKNSVTKYSILAATIVFLLSSTAMAQNTLSLLGDEIPTNSETKPLGSAENDDLNFSLDDELAPPSTQNNDLLAKDNKPLNVGKLSAPVEELQADTPEKEDPLIKAYNNYSDKEDMKNFANQSQSTEDEQFGDKIMSQVKEDLFSQMADIEKQTSLLTLELKREKIKNEIAAMKAQRQRAIEEEIEKQKEKERRQIEWEKEQERKLLEDQQKLKAMEIKYEKLRQERVLKAYKETMLKSNQEWVDYNSRLYNQLVKEEKSNAELLSKQKEYFTNLTAAIAKASNAAKLMKEKYNKDVANLQTQVAILKSKLEAEKSAFEESKKVGPNPFALVDDENAPKKKIAEEYAIMEISGKGEQLVAKLINKSGGTFMVKPGTILNTGHVIEEINQTYIAADKSGVKDYLYFSAGGILDKEPSEPLSPKSTPEVDSQDSKPATTSKIPSLREGMFVE